MLAKKWFLLLLRSKSLESGNGFITSHGAPAFKHGWNKPHQHNRYEENRKSHLIFKTSNRSRADLSCNSLFFPSSDTIQTLLSDVHVQASVLNDVANILLQVATIFDPSDILLRLAVAVSRILHVTADYLPSKSIAPDSLLFDVAGLVTAYFRFRRSANLFWLGILDTTTADDLRVYEHLFEPVGLTWRQFKTLKATSMDWVNIPSNTTLVCEDDVRLFINNLSTIEGGEDEIMDGKLEYMYWLYEGDVRLAFRGNEYYQIERTSGVSIDDPGSIGLMGDMRFICRFDLDSKRLRGLKKDKLGYFLYKCGDTQRLPCSSTVNLSYINDEYDNYLWATYKTGTRGATLLRINTDECIKTIIDDEDLATSFRLLLMKSLQRKVTALLKSQHEKEQNKVE